MIDIRPIHKDEIEQAQQLVPSSCCEPDWSNVWAILEDERLVGIIGMESRLIVEPLYVKDGHKSAAVMAMAWVDGVMRTWAGQLGKTGYEFFVGDEHTQFQEFLETRMPVRKGREKSGLYYFRKFEV